MDSKIGNSEAPSYWPADRTVPLLERTLGEALRAAAAEFKDQVAVIDGHDGIVPRRRWTFNALLGESEAVAHALLARFAPGERVALWAPNSPEWVLLEFGAALAGLTLVTVNPAYQANELAYVLQQSRVAGVIAAHEYRNRNMTRVVEEVRGGLPLLREVVSLRGWSDFIAGPALDGPLPEVGDDAIAQIQYTSGTTGFPKGAMLTHRGLINNARFYALANGAGADDVWINPMPLFHTAGCGLVTLGALQTGGKHVLMPRFDPQLMLRLVESERGTVTGGVPTMMIAALEQGDSAGRDLSSWRLVSMGGAPVPPDLVTRLQRTFGVRVSIGFGQTETSPFITHTQPDDPRPDWAVTVGRPLPQTEVKIVDPASGQTMPCGCLGELCARGYLLMKGYFDDPETTKVTIDRDGWLHTGDLAIMDTDGYCRIQGRLKDMIIRGGENIYPREIEAVLFGHPAVADVAIVGVPHDAWGEEVMAFIRPAAETQPAQEELAAYCRERLAAYKVPRYWNFVDRFPQTASGKVQKFILREMIMREASAKAGETSRLGDGRRSVSVSTGEREMVEKTMRGEKIYEYELDINGATDYGVALDDILAGKVSVPPQGARFDVTFEGRAKGRIAGRVYGTDFFRLRADGRGDLDLRITFETDDGCRIALSADGVAVPRAGEPIADIVENVTLTTAATDYAWVLSRQIWGVGTVNFATGKIYVEGYLQ